MASFTARRVNIIGGGHNLSSIIQLGVKIMKMSLNLFSTLVSEMIHSSKSNQIFAKQGLRTKFKHEHIQQMISLEPVVVTLGCFWGMLWSNFLSSLNLHFKHLNKKFLLEKPTKSNKKQTQKMWANLVQEKTKIPKTKTLLNPT